MTKREFNIALENYKRLKKEIDNIASVGVVNHMKILTCKGKSDLATFNLREYNKNFK